ncbi:MAG: hypothetical protein ABH818_03070, partial [Patescibacteria group bacterium]
HPFLKFEDGHYWVLLELTDDIIVARKWWRGGNHGEIIKKPIKSDFVGLYVKKIIRRLKSVFDRL